MIKLTLFSIEEANELIPELTPRLETLARAKHEFDRLETRIAALTLAVSGAAEGNPDAADLRQLLARKKVIEGQIAPTVHEIFEWGVLLKDVDRGLVDFYAMKGDRLIFLCWQLGEAEVSHWHPLDSGFSGRQPLNRSTLE